MKRKRILAEGKFIRFVKEGTYEYTERSNCRGTVVVVALTDEKKVLFTEQYRLPVRKNVIEYPAGLMDGQAFQNKESASCAARRELLEETGYRAQKVIKLIEGPVSSGMTADRVTLFRASGLKKVAKGGGDETEKITVHEIPLKKADQWLSGMRKKGYLIEPKIYAGLYFLRQKKGKRK
ncbi:MAG: NUDIX hydrolase [Candidatus Omnitrophota bacterium]